MVVNLCLPHFSTTAHCNKLCADGYDVTNIVSADPALRKRGFKLEYFLRPPLHVTLKFGFPVELCRVDVELWPWGMDLGQACKRLEISTSSDTPAPSSRGRLHHQERREEQTKDQNTKNGHKHQHALSQSGQSNGRQWSVQAHQWEREAPGGAQQTDFKPRSNSDSSCPDSDFKLVARCELREETQVSFSHSSFRPRPPFLGPPPPRPASCRQEKLWSRGPLSLGAVTQLRVAVPFGGSASSLGLKALAVWGQPARCCPSEQVARIERIHEANERRAERPVLFAAPVRPTAQTLPDLSVSIPEEFLDPLTQEVMVLPMLLPGGMSVDSSTLEEYQKREATWGRTPNDPFTGVPFTSSCQPLPNPQLKSRIDRFLLQKGMVRRDGALGGQDQGQNPQASRLVTSGIQGHSESSPSFRKASVNRDCTRFTAANRDTSRTSAQKTNTDLGPSSNDGTDSPPRCEESKSELNRRKKRDLSDISAEASTADEQLTPQRKKISNHSGSELSCGSHEQLLSASLDEALFSALQGRPSFTTNLLRQGESTSLSTACQSSGSLSSPTDAKVCSECSRSVSAYSASASSVYRLKCGHLLCRACLQKDSKPSNSADVRGVISCPACQSPTPRSNIIRVHH
uniref:RING finger protein 37 n=1 Tax=Fundulus heteroclitus TaxID=8078 RepID=A0A146P956_FUNHE